MTSPLILSQLHAEQAEVEARIESLTARIAEARSDLLHLASGHDLAATVGLFDPDAADKPATVYPSATKALRRSEMFAQCKAALEASAEPPCTRQLARYVIEAEGWDVEDRRLRLTVGHKVGLMMARSEKRGERQRASVWQMDWKL